MGSAVGSSRGTGGVAGGLVSSTPSSTDVSLREFMQAQLEAVRDIINERDKQYDSRFRAAEIAVNAALAAQEKAVNAAFTASEKAIVKAELAQSEYNVRSNEFRGQLADQAQTLIPRTEANVQFKGIEEKLAAVVVTYEGRLEALRASTDKANEAVAKDVASLRESRSSQFGSQASQRELVGYGIAVLAIIFAFIAHFIG
jgi:hypothetical protein